MKGLLLVGGKSSRMGTDKSEMIFRDGLTQRERGVKMLGEICDEVFISVADGEGENIIACLLYTSPSPRDATLSRMPSSA